MVRNVCIIEGGVGIEVPLILLSHGIGMTM